MLSRLTLTRRYKLRFDLQARNGSWYWAEYSSVVVLNEVHNYRMGVSGYTGTAGDALSYNSGSEFTTYDRDNDRVSHNCAVYNGGGSWYSHCGNYDFNSVRSSFKWSSSLYLQSTRMWLKC